MPVINAKDYTSGSGAAPPEQQQQQQQPPQEQQQPQNQPQPQPQQVVKKPAINVRHSNFKYDPQADRFPDTPTVTPRPFDPSIIKDDATCIFFGKRRTGKSFMTRHLLYAKRDRFPFGVVFTKTKFNGFWQQYVPERFVHVGYKPQVLEKILNRQRPIAEKIKQGVLKEVVKPRNKGEINPYFFVIFDDVISDGEVLRRDPLLQTLFTEGRHLKIPVFFCSQYAKGVGPVVRANCDYAFIFQCMQNMQRESLAEDFLGTVPKKEGMALLSKYCQGHQALVVDTSEETTDLNEILYVFTAQDPGPFKLGCREFWEGKEGRGIDTSGIKEHIDSRFSQFP